MRGKQVVTPGSPSACTYENSSCGTELHLSRSFLLPIGRAMNCGVADQPLIRRFTCQSSGFSAHQTTEEDFHSSYVPEHPMAVS
ncbi:hypothetical protein Q5P01_014330 [Channa striata]|uniref:Uncharacterized protein n=1 Tax=Channa striata TaxID=64152 RepID=A0AA88MIN1_CHASR|nr:hypothetical protein Q5P01_014330 [Channa striata]